MALENCLRVTTVGTARPQCFSTSKEKLVFPTQRVFKKSLLNNSTISYPSLYSTGGTYRKSRFICNASEAVNEVRVVTDSSWNNLVIASESPVLVEFWAPWCGPCRMIAPVIDELAKEYAGKIACFKINTDDSPNIATQYGIRSIPTVLFFKNGEKKESIIGAVPKSTLSATVEKYIDI
ncbi:Thioredoxin-like superfamily [Sesbania bispinosa]|nr:Thioredoxin-like superfamily [Sesbania bispinosa]